MSLKPSGQRIVKKANEASMEKNVFGETLVQCSIEPLTGFYRDGSCHTSTDDPGRHLVCAIMTDEFLQFSKSKGNDLSSPMPQYRFAGLKAGDRWYLCVLQWIKAWNEGKAPLIMLEATNEKVVDFISLNELVKYAWKNPEKQTSDEQD